MYDYMIIILIYLQIVILVCVTVIEVVVSLFFVPIARTTKDKDIQTARKIILKYLIS